jgi:DNA-binding NarL/FixJ family response regulator
VPRLATSPMRPTPCGRDRGDMPTSIVDRTDGTRPARIMIIDDHEISRAACRALLRTEGIDVIADMAAGDEAIAAAATLRPDVAVVDVSPWASAGFGMARGLAALPDPPDVVLTSSADPAEFDGRLEGHSFVAKAGLCAKAIRDAAASGALTRLAQSGDRRPVTLLPGSPATRLATSLMPTGAEPGDSGDMRMAPQPDRPLGSGGHHVGSC